MTATANQSNKDERRKIMSYLTKNEDLTLKWSQKLGKHQPAPHTHRQVRQVNGVREDPGIPRWSIVLTPAQAGRGECPDPDPCTPTELWPGHNSHSHYWDWHGRGEILVRIVKKIQRNYPWKKSTSMLKIVKVQFDKLIDTSLQLYMHVFQGRCEKIFQTPRIVRLRSFPDLHHEEHQ